MAEALPYEEYFIIQGTERDDYPLVQRVINVSEPPKLYGVELLIVDFSEYEWVDENTRTKTYPVTPFVPEQVREN